MYRNERVRLQLWDTAGQERFRSLIPSYLRDSSCAIVVFDLTRRSSFENIETWLAMYRENRSESPVVVLAGNKSDAAERYAKWNLESAISTRLKKRLNSLESNTSKSLLSLERIFNSYSRPA